jgi:hypothetical protein
VILLLTDGPQERATTAGIEIGPGSVRAKF